LKSSLKKVAVGIDIGGSHISVAIVDEKTKKIIPGSESRKDYDHKLNANTILQVWADAINSTLESVTDDMSLQGVGFAMPGPFDYKEGICRMDQKMISLFGLHIPTKLNQMLNSELGVKMRFLNDATCFAIGESIGGKGAGKDKVVVITLGTGFGSAFLDQDYPIVERDDVPSEGCLWHLPFGNSIADDYFASKWFVRYCEEQYSKKFSGVREILEIADNEMIDNIFGEFTKNLSSFIGPYLKKFHAEILIIGGNISKALPLFQDKLLELFKLQGVEIEIKSSELLEDAAIIGASKLLDDDYWTEVYKTIPNL